VDLLFFFVGVVTFISIMIFFFFFFLILFYFLSYDIIVDDLSDSILECPKDKTTHTLCTCGSTLML
jgi:hypothetical protein